MTGRSALPRLKLTLYVNGASPRSVAAIDNVRRICDDGAIGEVDLDIVDIYQKPSLAIRDDIVVTPTLIRRCPPPTKRVVGDLSDGQAVRDGLDLGTFLLRSDPI